MRILTLALLLCGACCASESVLLLRATKGDTTAHGGAVAVQHGGKTRLVTCWHLLEAKERFEVLAGEKWHQVKLLAKDEDLDLAELSAPEGVEGAKLDNRTIDADEHPVLLRSSHFWNKSRMKAEPPRCNSVPGRRGVARAAFVDYTGSDKVSQGCSGGALFRGGKCVGMIQMLKLDRHGVRDAGEIWYLPSARIEAALDWWDKREVAKK